MTSPINPPIHAAFYGFQFPHHGKFSAFLALSKAMHHAGVIIRSVPYPSAPAFLPSRLQKKITHIAFKALEYRVRQDFRMDRTVHYFFPENSLFRAPRWKRKGALVLSCHQPVQQIRAIHGVHKNAPFLSGLRTADAVVLMASNEIEAYRELAPHSKILCIPHGVDTDFFTPAASPPSDESTFRILTLGNWLRDYDLWAKVVDQVSARCPSVQFSLLANPDLIHKATKQLTTGARHVRILRNISDEQLREEYRRADVVFLPLQHAWANNALLESMSCGRPLVVTDLPATREYAGTAARYIAKGSAEAATEEILRLFHAPDERYALGQHARTVCATHFPWHRIAQETIALYRSLSTTS